jgi:protein-disulfide isomerase
LGLAEQVGSSPASLGSCLAAVDVQPQVDKDRAHARQRGVGGRPALFVNGKPVDDSEAALRRAIAAAIRAGSI